MAIDHTLIKALIEQNAKLLQVLETTIARALPDPVAHAPLPTFIPAESEPMDYTDWTDEFLPSVPVGQPDNRVLIHDDGPPELEDEIL